MPHNNNKTTAKLLGMMHDNNKADITRLYPNDAIKAEKKVDVNLELLDKLFCASITPGITQDMKNFIHNEISSLLNCYMVKSHDYYEKLLVSLMKTTSLEEREVIQYKMHIIRREEQTIVKQHLSLYAEEIERANIINDLERIKKGINEQPELHLLITALKNNKLSTNVTEFVKNEIAALRANPMASSPNYQLVLETLTKANLSPSKVEYLKEEMMRMREENQELTIEYCKIPIFMNKLGIEKENTSSLNNEENAQHYSPKIRG